MKRFWPVNSMFTQSHIMSMPLFLLKCAHFSIGPSREALGPKSISGLIVKPFGACHSKNTPSRIIPCRVSSLTWSSTQPSSAYRPTVEKGQTKAEAIKHVTVYPPRPPAKKKFRYYRRARALCHGPLGPGTIQNLVHKPISQKKCCDN